MVHKNASWSTEVIEQHIMNAVKSVQYGAVEVVIHDSQVVQIEKTEKIRIPRTHVSS